MSTSGLCEISAENEIQLMASAAVLNELALGDLVSGQTRCVYFEDEMKKQGRYLLQIAMADEAFAEAGSMIDHMLDFKPEPGSHLYHACVAGLTTCYCRPFKASNGVGPLPKSFRDFLMSDAPEDYASIHADILTARDKLNAHFDLSYGEAKFRSQEYELNPGEVEIVFGSYGHGLRTNHTFMPPHRIKLAHDLIKLQRSRVRKKVSDFADSLRKESGREFGRYVYSSMGGKGNVE